ncbi:hypothetical protein [Burkholderia ambifaria]|uniref:hypothetical protein n=1 Tax=Burkholderia ambifaria TaxID=152480 RepID=UPI000F80F86B|nr:hypothetical protein [Burkholderia ambifaria]
MTRDVSTNESQLAAHAALLARVTSAREIFETTLQIGLGNTSTRGSCLLAAILLRRFVENWESGFDTRIRGGDGVRDGGYVDADGVAHGHYWVEACMPARRSRPAQYWVADITADQFGAPPAQVLTLPDAERHYRPGSQHLVDAHVMSELAALGWAAA